jgi:hypothetical protein
MTLLGAFTLFHTLISLVQIVAGVALVLALIGRRPINSLAFWFLLTTAGTLATGFLFPFHGITPAIVIGILNVVILIATWLAWKRIALGRFWNAGFVIGSLVLLYFDCLVLIVQSFQKVPGLHSLAPVGNEPAVLVSQIVLLILALVFGFILFRGTRTPA